MAGRIFTAAVTVPTQFRGDLLATMGTTYVDGTNAGPADWPPSAARPSSCAARGLVP
ncbi:hypothetical protein ABT173_47415, partial [Streptomyces sp. NPDC001795]|uniref:hypothetical protein n=1 Tax=Streptomyces sp. NPDC001795 TaxID=3154525 RepID=UPI00331BED9F